MTLNDSSNGNASKLMSFLDKIETEIEEDTASIIAGSATETNDVLHSSKRFQPHSHSITAHHSVTTKEGDVSHQSVSGNTIFEGIKSKMERFKEDLKSKTERIDQLESAMKNSSERESTLKHKLENSERDRLRLMEQQKEFERVRNRQLILMERLVLDKEGLSAKVNKLSESMTSLRTSYESKIGKLKIEHKVLDDFRICIQSFSLHFQSLYYPHSMRMYILFIAFYVSFSYLLIFGTF